MKRFSIVICLLVISLIVVGSASAVTYQTGVGVGFTFNPTLSINLSSADILISNLAPGNAADSNTITVTVNTNTAYGYTLNATVGEATNYNTRNLIRSDINDNFSSIAYGSSLASLTTDNTWGYAYKPSGQSSTWTTYSGLPLYSDTNNVATLISTQDAADSDSVEFKIAAKASATQPAGEYRNVINFMAVSNRGPISLSDAYADAGKTKLNGYYKMQDMNSNICNAVEVEDDQLQVIDTRDNKVYWIAKLKDGNCWMTQNLDLDLGVATLTHNSTTLYHDDTDLGWGTDTATNSWTPIRGTIDATSGTITGWVDDNNTPYSVDTGDWYYAGYDGTTLLTSTEVNYLTSTNKVTDGDVTTVYDDTNHTNAYFKNTPFTGTGTSNNGTHGHVGNYYNWSAAVASNDTSAYQSSTYSDITRNPQNSICPAGWRLPTISNASNATAGSTNEFSRLNKLYNNNGSTITSAGLEASPLFFARGGLVSSLYSSGRRGYYWSSSAFSSSAAYFLYFQDTNVDPKTASTRKNGKSVRCVAR